MAALLDGTLAHAHAPAAVLDAAGAPDASSPLAHVPIEAAQLLGVYPNGREPPEGLGLAHHYVLGRWIDAGCPVGPPLGDGAP